MTVTVCGACEEEYSARAARKEYDQKAMRLVRRSYTVFHSRFELRGFEKRVVARDVFFFYYCIAQHPPFARLLGDRLSSSESLGSLEKRKEEGQPPRVERFVVVHDARLYGFFFAEIKRRPGFGRVGLTTTYVPGVGRKGIGGAYLGSNSLTCVSSIPW